MSTWEDKILNGPKVNYCSSSSSENGSDFEEEEAGPDVQTSHVRKWSGTSTNTGPKGVLNDCRQFEKNELERHKQLSKDRIEMIKKYSIACKSTLDEERDKVDPELLELYDDYLLDYQRKRMQEMILNEKKFKFGCLETLKNGEEFLNVIENNEFKNVLIIVKCCEMLNQCLNDLASEYYWIKFCNLEAATAGLSSHFKVAGIPAILVYKSGHLVGNFVRVTDEFGLTFDVDHVRDFLIENGILPNLNALPDIL